MNPIIELTKLDLAYDRQTVLQGLDWQVHAGKVIGLLGRNGSGKTCLLECLLGVRDPQAGQRRLFGEEVERMSDATRAKIGYVPQKADLFGWLTAREMLDYFRAMYPRWDAARVTAMLARWGLGDSLLRRKIAELSDGEQQRLSLVRAMAHAPSLLILDEPVASMDPSGRRLFLRELVDDVIEQGTTVIFSTHILSDLERVAMEVAFLRDGRIGLQAPLDQLLEGARRVIVPKEQGDSLRFANELRRIPLNDGKVCVIAWQQDWDAVDTALQVEMLSLEDLFYQVG